MRRLICFSLLLATCSLISSVPALAEKRGVPVGGKAPAEFFAQKLENPGPGHQYQRL